MEGVLSWVHTPEGQTALRAAENRLKVAACLLSGRMPPDRTPFPRFGLRSGLVR